MPVFQGLLTFELGGYRHGIDVADVSEVVRAVALSEAPTHPSGYEGVINLRGRIVPVVAVAGLLGLTPHPCRHTDHLIIVSAAGAITALRVDRVIELKNADGLELQSAPPGTAIPSVVGVASEPDGALYVHGRAQTPRFGRGSPAKQRRKP